MSQTFPSSYCASWEVMSIQYVQAPHPYGSTMMGGLCTDLRGPIKASKTNWISAGAQRLGRILQRDQFI